MPALPVTAVIYMRDDSTGKNKIQALFEIPFIKVLKKNGEYISKNGIINGAYGGYIL